MQTPGDPLNVQNLPCAQGIVPNVLYVPTYHTVASGAYVGGYQWIVPTTVPVTTLTYQTISMLPLTPEQKSS